MREFETGSFVATYGASTKMSNDPDFAAFVNDCCEWYASGDWGDLRENDKNGNETAVANNLRVFAKYIYSPDETSVYFFTEGDRLKTTIMIASNYEKEKECV